jgi:hypothetical protein
MDDIRHNHSASEVAETDGCPFRQHRLLTLDRECTGSGGLASGASGYACLDA